MRSDSILPPARLGAAVLLSALVAFGTGCSSGEQGASGLSGANGTATAVKIVAEPAGAHCANGGEAIESGLDANGNGQLDPDEVDASRTQYVCNGVVRPGSTTVTRVAQEPSGDHCQAGGVRLEVGADANGDGVLQDGEVNASLTQYLCEPTLADRTYFGDVDVVTPEDLARLDGIEVIIGNLSVHGNFGGLVSLPALSAVSGGITIGENPDAAPEQQVTGVDLPALIQAQTLTVQQHYLQTLSLPKLQRADEVIMEARSLASLDLSAFQRTSYLRLNELQVPSLSLPSLVRSDVVIVNSAPAMTTFSAPLLRDAQVQFAYDDVLTTLDLPSLTTIEDGSDVYGNDSLSPCEIARISLSAHQNGGHQVLFADGLSDFGQCDVQSFCPYVTVGSNSTTYRQCVLQQTWDEARSTCQSLGGDLVVFDLPDEYIAVRGQFGSTFVDNSWIGYTDAASEGTWAWVTGVNGYMPGAGEFWAQGEPSNDYGNENCAQLYADGHANDTFCGNALPFVCEIPPTP
jgi:hypothetical protein